MNLFLAALANLGVGIEVDKINRPNVALPTTVVSRIHAFVFGEPLDVAEVGHILH